MARLNEMPQKAKKAFSPKDAVLVFSSFALICAVILFALVIYDVLTIQDLLSFDKPMILATSVGIALTGLLLFGVIITLCTPANYIDDTNKSYQNFPVSVILAFTFAGALFEEMFFRGILQNVLYVYLAQQWLAIVITALLFVAMHVQYFKKPLMLLNITIPSLTFGWIYFETNNLLVPFLVHFLMNLGITLFFKYNVIRLKESQNDY